MRKTSPTGCIELKPTTQTVFLGGRPINVSTIARIINMDQSHLSRILAGKVYPTIPTGRKIAAALGMTLEELMDAVEERKRDIQELKERRLAAHFNRAADQDEHDIALMKAGKPVPPRLPGMRLDPTG